MATEQHLPMQRITSATQVKEGDTILYFVLGRISHRLDWSFKPAEVVGFEAEGFATLIRVRSYLNREEIIDTFDPEVDELYIVPRND